MGNARRPGVGANGWFGLVAAPLAVLLAGSTCAPGSGEAAYTYHRDVAPILQARCAGCHTADGIGTFDIQGYANAAKHAGPIASAVVTRVMPPWMPADDIRYQHERRLGDAEIETIRAWAQAGAPEGDPKSAPAPVEPDVPTIQVDHEVKMKSAYRPDTTEPDDYRCFVLDPEFTGPRAITGFDIRPGNRRIVHHVILFNVDPEQRDEVERLDAATPGEGYTCFGDARVDAWMVGAWVPGTTATVFPYGTGVSVKAGSLFVMQVHYNTLEVKDGEDLTTAQLELTAATNVKPAYIFPIADWEFAVPPGEVKTVTRTFDTAEFGLPRDAKVTVYGTAPHMHLHGRSLKVYATRGERVIPLGTIPKWDFHWQQLYFYEEPVELEVGDRITIECTFDNREHTQPIVNGERVPATTLRWGEGTLEEMCLSFFYATL